MIRDVIDAWLSRQEFRALLEADPHYERIGLRSAVERRASQQPPRHPQRGSAMQAAHFHIGQCLGDVPDSFKIEFLGRHSCWFFVRQINDPSSGTQHPLSGVVDFFSV
jgi:hypothetical protein